MGNLVWEMRPGNPVQPCPVRGDHWLEIRLVDSDGDSVPYEEYLVTLPDGSSASGYLDADGWARFCPLQDAGTCQVSFPRFDAEAWRYDHAEGTQSRGSLIIRGT